MVRTDDNGDVVVWTIDRPASKNALDLETIAALTESVRTTSARAAVITGANGVFVSGGDLRELRDRMSIADAEHLSDTGYELTSAIAAAPYPIIAALPGVAIGGGAELAVACDLRIAAPTARIAFKQVRLGVTSAWGAAERLRDLVGIGAASRLLLVAEDVPADEALRIGLVDAIDTDCLGRAIDWANKIALGSPQAIAASKKLMRTSGPLRATERSGFVETWTSDAHQRAVEAWFQRLKERTH